MVNFDSLSSLCNFAPDALHVSDRMAVIDVRWAILSRKESLKEDAAGASANKRPRTRRHPRTGMQVPHTID